MVFGDNLFTYVAHVPAGGVMAPDAEEAKLFELSLFMIEGELVCTLGTEDMTVRPADALLIPRGVAFGVRNETDATASFVLSFSPPPRTAGIEKMLAEPAPAAASSTSRPRSTRSSASPPSRFADTHPPGGLHP